MSEQKVKITGKAERGPGALAQWFTVYLFRDGRGFGQGTGSSPEEAAAHAEEIVTAVNAHDALVKAAQNALTALRYLRDKDTMAWDLSVTPEICNAWDDLRAALALAKSTEQDNGDPSEPGHPDNPRSNYDEVRDRL